MYRTAVIASLTCAFLVACGGSDGSNQDQASTASTTAQQAAIDWKYLQREYSAYLASECSMQLEGAEQNTCVSTQQGEMSAFARDAEELPPSADRAKLLEKIDDYNAEYAKYRTAVCPVSDSPTCVTAPMQMNLIHGLIVQYVKNNSGGQ